MKTQLAVSLGFILALGATAPLAQQPSPPLSAPLLRRLAEAADGYRTGKAIYVVASVRAPYDVRGVFETDSLATIEARKGGASYRVFGPYVTPRDDFRAAPAEILDITVKVQTAKGPVSVTVNPKEYDAMFWSLGAVDKFLVPYYAGVSGLDRAVQVRARDRKSTRLNSSHGYISYAVFCLKKKKKTPVRTLSTITQRIL